MFGPPTPRSKFERFFEHFHEYDNIVVATFPTCHDPTLRALLSLRLPQRYIALVHNPEYLNNTQVGVGGRCIVCIVHVHLHSGWVGW